MPSPPAFYWLRGDFPIMSRSAAAPQQKPGPRIRRARFAEEDLVSTFGETMLAEARRLLGAGAVDLTTTGRAIEATIVADGEHLRVVLNPTQTGPRVAFLGTCEPNALSASSTGSRTGPRRGRLRPSRGSGFGRTRARSDLAASGATLALRSCLHHRPEASHRLRARTRKRRSGDFCHRLCRDRSRRRAAARSISDGANEADFGGIAPKNYWK